MEEENDDVETHTPTSPGRDVTSSTPDVVIEAQKESVRFAKPADSYRLESDVNQNVKKVVLRRSHQNRTPGDEVKDNIVACHVTNEQLNETDLRCVLCVRLYSVIHVHVRIM